jgi:membrane-bound metal-dependent hydrolase YbcI (DUF457 family)
MISSILKKKVKELNAIAHILVTLVFARVGNLSGIDIFLALLFGVAIDLDHLIKVPLYIKQNGLKVVRYWNWRTSFQEPVSYLWIIPLCIYFQTWVPVFFFTTHIVLDYLMSYEKQPFYPFSDFKIPNMKVKIDDYLGVLTAVVAGCMLFFLV